MTTPNAAVGELQTRKPSKWRSPDSYSSFLVTIRLSRLVSEILACDRQTTRTIATAGRHTANNQ